MAFSERNRKMFPPKEVMSACPNCCRGNPTLTHPPILLLFDTPVFSLSSSLHLVLPFFPCIASISITSGYLYSLPLDLTDKRQFVLSLILLIDLLVIFIETGLCRQTHLMEVNKSFFLILLSLLPRHRNKCVNIYIFFRLQFSYTAHILTKVY